MAQLASDFEEIRKLEVNPLYVLLEGGWRYGGGCEGCEIVAVKQS